MKGKQIREYKLVLENFEGPFDLLFHLIETNEMDLYDIQISEITHQYLDYLFVMEKLNLDIASEFLVMAATLLHIKSQMLLPREKGEEKPEEGEDPRTQLVLKLVEYQKYRKGAEHLRQEQEKGARYFYRGMSEDNLPRGEKTYTYSPGTLKTMYASLLQKNVNKKNRKVRAMKQILMLEKYTVRDKMARIAGMLAGKERLSFFDDILKPAADPMDRVVGFLSILELAKERKVMLEQRRMFGDIKIEKTDHFTERERNPSR